MIHDTLDNNWTKSYPLHYEIPIYYVDLSLVTAIIRITRNPIYFEVCHKDILSLQSMVISPKTEMNEETKTVSLWFFECVKDL